MREGERIIKVQSDDDADDDEMTCALPPQLLYCALTRPQSRLQEWQLCRQRCGDTAQGYHGNQRHTTLTITQIFSDGS